MINQEEYKTLKREIEDEIYSWDGAESGWGEYAVNNVLTLIDRFFLGGMKMSWAEDQDWFGMEDIVIEKMEIENEIRADLQELSNEQLLKKILSFKDKEYLNNVVKDNKFPAYDIAERILNNRWTMTEKQRKALTNIYVHARINEYI